jgi:hypothetical protein
MLPPDQRVVLREILRPPLDGELDLAVGTSFTLDLNSAVVVPLAFASHELSRSGDPVAVLEAIRASASRVHLFAQAGQLKIPTQRSDLVAFLEPMVHEVVAPRSGYLFHPKVWVLRFRDEAGELTYRLVCGTRNLTEDSSWDAVLTLDGVVEGRRRQARNRPLSEFVRALPTLAVRPLEDSKVAAIGRLADELEQVTWDLPDGAHELAFHALGIGARQAAQRVNDALDGRRAVVVSPFLDDDTIGWFRDNVADFELVSRVEALEALLPKTVIDLACRVLNPLAGIDGVESDEAPTSEPTAPRQQLGLLGGLHAKVYAVENGAQARLLIGSSNATSAGLDDLNVEFLVELQGHRKHFGVDQLLGTDAEFASIFDHYEPAGGRVLDPLDEAGRELERLLRRVAAVPLTARVQRSGDGWSERVSSARAVEVDDGVRFTVGLVTVEGRVAEQRNGPVEATFELQSIADITPFVCLRVSQRVGATIVERGTVVRAHLIGDPPDRLDEILARQFDTAEKFLRFVMLLLSLRDGPPIIPNGNNGEGDNWSWAGIAGSMGLFESLVRAVAERPRAIDDLDRLVNRLQRTERGASVLPDGFAELWKSIVDARNQLEASS